MSTAQSYTRTRSHERAYAYARTAPQAGNFATQFIENEWNRALPDLAVCVDGIACGPSGGPAMYEAVAALSTALGTSVPVRKGRCDSGPLT